MAVGWVVAFMAIVALSFPVYHVELARWEQCYADCIERQAQNAQLLANPLCADPAERARHGPKATKACEAATRENREFAAVCATRTWWREGEAVALWTRLTDSRLMLLSMVLPVTLFGMWCVAHYIGERAKERATLATFTACMQQMQQQRQPQFPLLMPAHGADQQPTEVVHRHVWDASAQFDPYDTLTDAGGGSRKRKRFVPIDI